MLAEALSTLFPMRSEILRLWSLESSLDLLVGILLCFLECDTHRLFLQDTNGYRLAMKQFDESIKPGFRSRDDEDQYINFPMANLKDDPSKKIKSNCITLTGFVHASAVPTSRLADSIA